VNAKPLVVLGADAMGSKSKKSKSTFRLPETTEAEDFANLLAEAEWAPDKAEDTAPKSKASTKEGSVRDLALDLHGLSLPEAIAKVDMQLNDMIRLKGPKKLRIITGKGRHSSGGTGTLIHGVYDHVARSWSKHLESIDTPPGNDLIQGLPLRGHFDLKLKS
jgi:DNA-nicking Smr family endonuclease